MFINYQALLLGTASLLCGLVAAENKFDAQFEGGRCAKSIMNDYMRVGGERGDMFCEQRSDWGGVVTGIEVWANQEGVNGLKFYFSDGNVSPQRGTQYGESKRADWKPQDGDLITQIEMWGDGTGDHLGRIKLTFNSGFVFEHGRDGANPFTPQAGSGIMLAAIGMHIPDGGIINVAFLMLKSKVTKIELGDLEYKDTNIDEMNERREGITDRIITDAHFVNSQENGNTMDYGMEERWATQDKTKWETTMTHTVGVALKSEVEAKILGFEAKHSVELSYSFAHASMKGGESVREDIRVISVKGQLDKGEEVWCRTVAERGEFEGEFTTTVRVHLEEGGPWEFNSEGKSTAVKYAEFNTKCQSKSFKDDLERAPTGEVRLVDKSSKKRMERTFVA